MIWIDICYRLPRGSSLFHYKPETTECTRSAKKFCSCKEGGIICNPKVRRNPRWIEPEEMEIHPDSNKNISFLSFVFYMALTFSSQYQNWSLDLCCTLYEIPQYQLTQNKFH